MRDNLGKSGTVIETLGQPAYKRPKILDRDASLGNRSTTQHHMFHRRYLITPGTFTSSQVDTTPDTRQPFSKWKATLTLKATPRCGVWCLTPDGHMQSYTDVLDDMRAVAMRSV